MKALSSHHWVFVYIQPSKHMEDIYSKQHTQQFSKTQHQFESDLSIYDTSVATLGSHLILHIAFHQKYSGLTLVLVNTLLGRVYFHDS